MKLIVCLDDKNGMAFWKKRQSSDKIVCERILLLCGGKRLYMNGYSQKLFDGMGGDIVVDKNFLDSAGKEDYCFTENVDVTPYIAEADEIILMRWNRVYPADLRFPAQQLSGWKKVDTAQFPGNSHECITQEVYRR